MYFVTSLSLSKIIVGVLNFFIGITLNVWIILGTMDIFVILFLEIQEHGVSPHPRKEDVLPFVLVFFCSSLNHLEFPCNMQSTCI